MNEDLLDLDVVVCVRLNCNALVAAKIRARERVRDSEINKKSLVSLKTPSWCTRDIELCLCVRL